MFYEIGVMRWNEQVQKCSSWGMNVSVGWYVYHVSLIHSDMILRNWIFEQQLGQQREDIEEKISGNVMRIDSDIRTQEHDGTE